MASDGSSPRVLVGQFFLEANSFAPGVTRLVDFESAGLLVGDDLRRDQLPDDGELPAAWDVLVASGVRIVPAIRAFRGAGPPADRETWRFIRDAILDRADDQIAGVYLALHGASLAEETDDPEGELLECLRARLGPGVPLAVSLDCHAGWTDRMERNVDIVTAYGAVPHTDTARTGRQAARILLAALRGDVRPVTRSHHIPMIAGATRQDSTTPEFRSIMEAARAHERRAGVLSAAFLPSHPWRDVPELSWSGVATCDADVDLAQSVARDLALGAWTHRHWLAGIDAMPLRELLPRALGGPLPAVIADAGDSPTGGALGDSTEMLRACLDLALQDHGGEIWIMVTDLLAAQAARSVAVGTELRVEVGHGDAGDHNARTEVIGTVLAHVDGRFKYAGPLAAGVAADMGPSAVLGVGNLRVVLHPEAVMEIDPAPLLAAGMRPESVSLVQAKSHVSFRAGYEHMMAACYVADTAGPTAANLLMMQFRRRPVPLFPFEADAGLIDAVDDDATSSPL